MGEPRLAVCAQVLSLLSDCNSGLGIVKCSDAVPRPRRSTRLDLH